MAMMRRADTVFALDAFEEAESSSSEEGNPMQTGDPLIQQRVVQRGMGVLKTKLEPELWTRRFAFRAYLMIISLVNVQDCWGLGAKHTYPHYNGGTWNTFVIWIIVLSLVTRKKALWNFVFLAS
eukprot:g14733.t1